MGATTVAESSARLLSFWDTTLGKKVVMAVTGFILFGFVLAHMLGNLQIFLGPEALNGYALQLREHPVLLWFARLLLLVAVALHMAAAIQLARLRAAARPVSYEHHAYTVSTFSSRHMLLSGAMIAAFVVYHLLHFTWGTVHPQFQHLRPYENVVAGFRSTPVAAAYIVAMVLLGIHLHHGMWSIFQTLGLSHPRYTPWFKRFAAAMATVITLGFISVPLAVLAGVVS